VKHPDSPVTGLKSYGWTPARQQAFAPFAEQGLVPARVVAQHRSLWTVMSDTFQGPATLTGRLSFHAVSTDLPVTGDWVALDPGSDHARIAVVLDRTGTLARKAAGTSHTEQLLGANIDLALLVMALNGDFNPRRLERYLALCRAGGVEPLVVLTKADLHPDPDAMVDRLQASVRASAAGSVPVLVVSALTLQGIAALKRWLVPGLTSVLLGSSGAGKSTLVNALAGEEIMHTATIREADDRGRHTTTHRELILLPNGALILDTPGMRELGLVGDESNIAAGFADVSELAAQCRFSDCTHTGEPDCAVQAALANRSLDPARLASWQKLMREQAYDTRRDNPEAQAAHKKRWKQVHKHYQAKVRLRDRQIE
jgi:ribosome biogenesis GTPase / thiamine phosphate phosphatase